MSNHPRQMAASPQARQKLPMMMLTAVRNRPNAGYGDDIHTAAHHENSETDQFDDQTDSFQIHITEKVFSLLLENQVEQFYLDVLRSEMFSPALGFSF